MDACRDQMNLVDRARLVESCGARDDSPSWNLGLVKQGDTIRVDGASPRGQGQEDVKESDKGVLQRATTRPSREREQGRTQDQGLVRRSRRVGRLNVVGLCLGFGAGRPIATHCTHNAEVSLGPC